MPLVQNLYWLIKKKNNIWLDHKSFLDNTYKYLQTCKLMLASDAQFLPTLKMMKDDIKTKQQIF